MTTIPNRGNATEKYDEWAEMYGLPLVTTDRMGLTNYHETHGDTARDMGDGQMMETIDEITGVRYIDDAGVLIDAMKDRTVESSPLRGDFTHVPGHPHLNSTTSQQLNESSRNTSAIQPMQSLTSTLGGTGGNSPPYTTKVHRSLLHAAENTLNLALTRTATSTTTRGYEAASSSSTSATPGPNDASIQNVLRGTDKWLANRETERGQVLAEYQRQAEDMTQTAMGERDADNVKRALQGEMDGEGFASYSVKRVTVPGGNAAVHGNRDVGISFLDGENSHCLNNAAIAKLEEARASTSGLASQMVKDDLEFLKSINPKTQELREHQQQQQQNTRGFTPGGGSGGSARGAPHPHAIGNSFIVGGGGGEASTGAGHSRTIPDSQIMLTSVEHTVDNSKADAKRSLREAGSVALNASNHPLVTVQNEGNPHYASNVRSLRTEKNDDSGVLVEKVDGVRLIGDAEDGYDARLIPPTHQEWTFDTQPRYVPTQVGTKVFPEPQHASARPTSLFGPPYLPAALGSSSRGLRGKGTRRF